MGMIAAYQGTTSVIIMKKDECDISFLTSDDYSNGKLIRNGKDFVHCIKPDSDQKIYDPNEVRKKLKTIPELIKGQQYTLRQNHGNVGMNNWCVAWDGKKLIAPMGELLFERIYPSFVKTCNDKYIADIFYYIDKSLKSDVIETLKKSQNNKNYEFLPLSNAISELNSQTDYYNKPDDECDYKYLYISVIENAAGITSVKTDNDNRYKIDWNTITGNNIGFEVLRIEYQDLFFLRHFIKKAEVKNKNREKVRIPGSEISFEEVDMQFSFMGIPLFGFNKDNRVAKLNLKDILHFFYDIRHIYDPGIISIDIPSEGKKDFYLAEYNLKCNNYAKARTLLDVNGANYIDFDINGVDGIIKLINFQNPKYAKSIKSVLYSENILKNNLKPKYKDKVTALPTNQGEYKIDWSSTPKNLKISPLRNVYPLSFIGTLGDNHIIFAVTAGVSGVRPGPGSGANLRIGYTIEEAISQICKVLIDYNLKIDDSEPDEELENKLAKIKTKDSEPDEKLKNELAKIKTEDQSTLKLLLLDQGGDVVQEIKSGGVGCTVSSSEGRESDSSISATILAREVR